jgi:hypothetical protein
MVLDGLPFIYVWLGLSMISLTMHGYRPTGMCPIKKLFLVPQTVQKMKDGVNIYSYYVGLDFWGPLCIEGLFKPFTMGVS